MVGGQVLQLGGGGGVLAVGGGGGGGSLQITTGSLPAVNQYATSYSSTLAASGGTAPYTWSLVSQSGFNPNTWQVSTGGVITNLMAKILNVEVNSLVVQVTDATSTSVQKTLSITCNRQVPAGASALGYTQLIWTDNPTLSEISFATYGSTIATKWQSGWPYDSTIPPASLYSMNAQGVLQLANTGGTAGQGPASYRPVMSSVQLSNGSNVPIAAGLPVWSVGAGYYIEYSIQVVNPNSGSWITGFQFPTQHNINGSQQVDPFDGLVRYLEFDVWEGSGSNGQSSGNWGGGGVYWAGATNPGTAFRNSNTTPPEPNVTLQHTYGMSWHPGTAQETWYLDNVQSGQNTLLASSGTPMTPEQLAWVNSMTDFAMCACWNNLTTGYQGLFYYVSVYAPPALTALWTDPLSSGIVGTAYSYTLTASGGIPPYTFSQTSGTLPGGLSLTGAVISGTPTTPVSADAVTFAVTDSA